MTAAEKVFVTVSVAWIFIGAAPAYSEDTLYPRVYIETTAGSITIELNPTRAPLSVKNFLAYVESGFYEGTIFHRVVAGFVIQGGGYTSDLKLKPTRPNIDNESGNGLSNLRGTVAMARTGDPHSGDSQFFINLVNNDRLDPMSERWGYAVFGEIVEGMDVVDDIGYRATGPAGPFAKDVPVSPVIIQRITLRAKIPSPDSPPPEVASVSSGTCFVASSDGTIITAYHVVGQSKSIKVILSDGRTFDAEIKKINRANDLAILNIDARTPKYLGLADASTLSIGDRVFTIGFPASTILGKEPKFTEGSISSLSGLRGENSLMQISVPIQPGNSGGPLVSENGAVAGVITSTAAVEAFYRNTGALPQNINWAVKSSYAGLLFDAPSSPTVSSRREAIDQAKQAVCQIIGSN